MTEHSRAEGSVVVTDLRGIDNVYVGNRHIIYALYPEQNVSVRVFDGKDKKNCVFSVGYSVLNRTATVDVDKLMLKYGGGGHRRVGTCQVPYSEADRVLGEMLEEINAQNWQMVSISGLESL